MIALPPISPELARIAAQWHMRRAMGRASRYLSGADLRGDDLSGAYRPEGSPGYTVDTYGYLRAV